MLSLIKRFSQNKIFYIFLIVFILLMPSTLNLSAEGERRGIVTSLGIDKVENGILVSASIVLPLGSSNLSSNLHFVNAEGTTVNDAVYNLKLALGKKVGLAHCEIIFLNEELFEDDVMKYLDFFIRTNNLIINSVLIVTNDKAKDVVSAIVNGGNPHSQALRNLIEIDDKFIFTTKTTIESFYKAYYGRESVAFVGIVNTTDEEGGKADASTSQTQGSGSQIESDSGFDYKELESKLSMQPTPKESGSESSGSESSSSSSGGESGGSSGDSGGEEKKKKVLDNEGKVAVIKKGKIERELTSDEIECLNLFDTTVRTAFIEVRNVDALSFKNATITFEIFEKNLKKKWFFNNGVPVLKYNISLYLKFDEINADNYTQLSIDEISPILNDELAAKIDGVLKQKVSMAFNNSKKYKTDLFAVYSKFDSYLTKQWRNFLKTLDDESDYLDYVLFEIDFDIYHKY